MLLRLKTRNLSERDSIGLTPGRVTSEPSEVSVTYTSLFGNHRFHTPALSRRPGGAIVSARRTPEAINGIPRTSRVALDIYCPAPREMIAANSVERRTRRA